MTIEEAAQRVVELADRLRDKAADLNAQRPSEKYDPPEWREARETEMDAEALDWFIALVGAL